MIAAIYARKSTEQNGVADDERSVTRQVEHARTCAARKGWTVDEAHIYVDDGISGAEFANRPGFLRLMNAVATKPRPPFDALIMSEESRLGRESIEVSYALKQIVTAGVRVFFYLEDRERTLESPMDKVMLSLTAFADELEREKARQRTYDALQRKAAQGHVAGGRVFGYDNVTITVPGPDGKPRRSHVERRINEPEAAVVRRLFELCAQGYGMKTIAVRLNNDGALCPRSQRERPAGWCPSSVREVLYRDLYRGVVVWNRTRKRDAWGKIHPRGRPEADWIRREVPELRIVDEDLWQTAHDRLSEARALYLRGTDGQLWGHPARGTESKYLLVGLTRCGVCGAGVSVRSRWQGRRRSLHYHCTANLLGGPRKCGNAQELPMEVANEAILTAIREQILSPAVIEAAVAEALERLTRPEPGPNVEALRRELQTITTALDRLTEELAGGLNVASVRDAIRARERRKQEITALLARLERGRPLTVVEPEHLRAAMREKLEEWHAPLSRHVAQARQLLRKLLVGRLTFTPDDAYATLTGQGTVGPFLAALEGTKGMASPTGFEPVFWP